MAISYYYNDTTFLLGDFLRIAISFPTHCLSWESMHPSYVPPSWKKVASGDVLWVYQVYSQPQVSTCHGQRVGYGICCQVIASWDFLGTCTLLESPFPRHSILTYNARCTFFWHNSLLRWCFELVLGRIRREIWVSPWSVLAGLGHRFWAVLPTAYSS